jgi:hypothetical protein
VAAAESLIRWQRQGGGSACDGPQPERERPERVAANPDAIMREGGRPGSRRSSSGDPYRMSISLSAAAASRIEDDAALMAKWRQKVTDVHHLTGHLMAGHDALVTGDHDMLKKRPSREHEPGSWSSTLSRPFSSPTAKPPDHPQLRQPPDQRVNGH